MAATLKLLFFTNSEHGQANAVLSVAHELRLRKDTEVHIGSFADLESRVDEVNAIAQRNSPNPSALHFHALEGRSMAEILSPKEMFFNKLQHERGFSGLWKAYRDVPVVFMCWPGEEYVRAVRSIQSIIGDVKPDLVIIDGNFYIGTDGARAAGVDFMFISPNSFKDITGNVQPNAAVLWKIPPFGSGWRFPMRIWQIPLNFILQARLLIAILSYPNSKGAFKARKDAGLNGEFPMFDVPNVPFVCPCRPEMDFPVHVPENCHGCGPFLLPFEPLEKVDPDLAEWIQRGPLVLINRGSHLQFSGSQAQRMACGIRILRQQRPEVRILWKLKPGKDFIDDSLAAIQDDTDSDMVRTVPWIKPEMIAIMRTGKVICSVNHGGANSWYEAAGAGIPQVILPAWYDCYDWAVRSEAKAIGVWGNRKSGLALDGRELGKALLHACEEPWGEQLSGDVDVMSDAHPLLSATSDYNEGKRHQNLRINAQRLAAKAGEPGAKNAAEIVINHAAECRRKKAEAST